MIGPCLWCDELIDHGEEHHSMRQFHHECAVRMVAGSLAHIERRCRCFGGWGDETDPPGVSRREAARLAYAAFVRWLN